MSESKQYKSLFIMCSELRAEIKSLRQEMKELRESKSSCQHEASANAIDEDEELLENPNQEIFDNISTDMNNIIESVDKANDYTEREVARLDIDLSEIKEHVKELEAVKPQVHTLSEHKCPAIEKTDEMASHIAILFTQTEYLKSSRDLNKKQIKNIEYEVNHIRSVQEKFPHQFNNYQFRIPRPRICYNCRRPGHEARNCHQPNPRMPKA